MEWIPILVIVLAGFIALAGIIGCFLPVIPGPPLNFLSLLLLHFFTPHKFSNDSLLFFLFLSLLVTVLDYVVPMAGAKKMGGSKYGLWGCGIGLIAGIFFPPVGFVAGPFLGAFVGELYGGKSGKQSLKAALGSFLGFLLGTFVKLFASLAMTYYFVDNLIH